MLLKNRDEYNLPTSQKHLRKAEHDHAFLCEVFLAPSPIYSIPISFSII